MAWWKYEACGHLKFVGPPRTMKHTLVKGYCKRCNDRIKHETISKGYIRTTTTKRIFVGLTDLVTRKR